MVFNRSQSKEKITKNFRAGEFFCKCGSCNNQLVNVDHVKKLQLLRDLIEEPIKITSGYRCPEHNKSVGGSSNSQHTLGNATDIQVNNLDIEVLANICEVFDGLGRYDTFTHIDSRGYKARW